jgi:hypothetical protein
MFFAPLVVAVSACGSPTLPPPTKQPQIGMGMGGKVVVRLIGQSSSETSDVDAGMAAGRLFLVRKTADNITWVNCGNVIVPYGWRPSDKHIEHIDAENESDLHAKLPFAAGMSFGAEFEQGNRVRVWIASAGAFHVDENQVKIPAGCKATHYVSTITVGAYSIVSLSATSAAANAGVGGMGASGHAGERKLQGSEQGELDKCSNGGQGSGPPDSCRTPVEILLSEVDRSMVSYDQTAPPPTDHGPAPTPTSVPKPESQCSQLVKHTGDITADINALGDACGTKFGLAAVADPYSRTLSQNQGWQRQFQMELPAGCYRLFAAGDSGIQDLDTGIKDAAGNVIAQDSSNGPMPVLNPDGPFCITSAQKVDLFARVGKGAGRYAMWLWKKK